jgi:probable phosphoglycerate mutase
MSRQFFILAYVLNFAQFHKPIVLQILGGYWVMSAESRKTLSIIRHGETVFNSEHRFQGHSDSPLTETGRNQVTALGRRLKDFEFDAIISSDLGRTRETAAIIAGFTGHSVELDSRLRERNYGVLEGLTVPEIVEKYSEVFDQFNRDDPDYVIPEGESHRQHYQRNVDFFEEFLTGRFGNKAAVIAHGGVLDSIFRFVSKIPLHQPRSYITANASLTMVSHGEFYGTTRWVIETWCDTAHLNGIGLNFGLG